MTDNQRIELNQSCVLCGSTQFIKVYSRYHEFPFCEPFLQNIVVCHDCGLSTVELNQSYSTKNLNAYYKSVPRTPIDINTIEEQDPRVKNAQKRIEFIRESTFGNTMLEIGFGDGITLLEAKKSGYEITGIDISEGYEEEYKFLTNCGIDIVNDDFYFATFKKKFEIISAFLLFEHIPEPNVFLRRIKELISNDGFLIIEVPNLANYQNFLSETMLTHEHIFHYSNSTLNSLMNKNGFQLVESLPNGTSYGFSLTNCYQLNTEKTVVSQNHAWRNESLLYFENYFKRLNEYKSSLKKYIEELIAGKEKIYVFGAGLFFEVLWEVSNGEIGTIIEAFIDETKSKIGNRLKGKPIISLTDFDKVKPYRVLIASEAFSSEIASKLKSHNLEVIPLKIYDDVVTKMKSHESE